jgi:hypothetical protein
MKTQLKNIFAILIMAVAFTSCSKDEEIIIPVVDELESFTKFKEITNATHTIELYSHMTVEQGYNEIKLRIKNNANNQYVKNADITWMPIMHMAMMNHSCPKSEIEKVSTNGEVYEGYIMFQMAQNATEYWDLKIDYIIDGVSYTSTTVIDVPASAKRKVNTFTGSDGVKYLVAYVDPHHPKVAVNDLAVGVWKMQDMMTFPVVDGYTVKIDPRMPSMGNHSSPNNVNATQTNSGDLYNGKLSLTMTGYWKINLQLAKPDGTIVKGEEITGTVTDSSIYFELEF